jgi:hypothetical protein
LGLYLTFIFAMLNWLLYSELEHLFLNMLEACHLYLQFTSSSSSCSERSFVENLRSSNSSPPFSGGYWSVAFYGICIAKKNSVCGHLFQVLVLPCPCKKSMNDVFGAKCFLSGSESDTFHVLLWICNNFYQTGLWLQHNFYYMSSTFNLTWLCLYKTND